MSETAILSPKFQIAIPAKTRAARGWQAGQVFALIPKGAGVLLMPVPERDELAGIAKGASTAGYRDRVNRI
ncbi:AbrB/MazE/SpoVT family DNA-binding domain-containing protein [Ruixingdingia sedimenti]|uniref:AbrB/MazE/SpoVT family DNA-binding domain-containing protein n=1 Tax=Ruixingdingia sedimenti TaxID=3073604 RepID=A0ABU1FBI5_9RHOB|nr:AbrB/MazE/SpoVT family DNA-binding domain-containing protein [Xinfangfangia sp. LG-4]MDR5654231.1 AbrB/MazE/SpoVT family DNA-binding domain-containing protein [Xinfangfangia sp. LG-4]